MDRCWENGQGFMGRLFLEVIKEELEDFDDSIIFEYCDEFYEDEEEDDEEDGDEIENETEVEERLEQLVYLDFNDRILCDIFSLNSFNLQFLGVLWDSNNSDFLLLFIMFKLNDLFVLRLVVQSGRITTVVVRVFFVDFMRRQFYFYVFIFQNGRMRLYIVQFIQQRFLVFMNGQKIRTDVSSDMRRRNYKCFYNGCKKVYIKSFYFKVYFRTYIGNFKIL